ncbi:MAG: glycine cleavage system aminomethyltransferase GcvT [Actinomycetota bacterium]|nr:glycine cleavage system aminomethyltransferase GcvT [Actinomycetota bacterium]
MSDSSDTLDRTALYDLHLELGGRMVPFAGHELPVRYGPGPVAEHNQARTAAALFDVSHMGIVQLRGDDVPGALERLVPSNMRELKPQRMRYTFLTTPTGGVIDDLMVTNDGEGLTLVVNAANKAADLAHLEAGLDGVDVISRPDLSLLALQGPTAVDALARLAPEVADLVFMETATITIDGVGIGVSRSGYTGEDGFELSVPTDHADAIARRLLAEPEVEPAGLAARDSLRLEAGLCLHGHDLSTEITPIEAGLLWAIQKRRRTEGGFIGDDVILRQIADGAPRHRVGIRPSGRKPVREGAVLRGADGTEIGEITSGGFGPTVGAPVAMGFVATGHEATGAELVADVRGTEVPCTVADLPFAPHRYHRG